MTGSRPRARPIAAGGLYLRLAVATAILTTNWHAKYALSYSENPSKLGTVALPRRNIYGTKSHTAHNRQLALWSSPLATNVDEIIRLAADVTAGSSLLISLDPAYRCATRASRICRLRWRSCCTSRQVRFASSGSIRSEQETKLFRLCISR